MTTMRYGYFLSFALWSFISFVTSKDIYISHSIGDDIQLECDSNYAPPWMWFGPKSGDFKTLSGNGLQPSPKLKDARFSFGEIRGENRFFLRLSSLRLKDAGKFVCDGEPTTNFFLTVFRYVFL